ncbi:putative T7SS-secreted protein [Streptomyces sp. NPDC127077]|uniref:putative T7SS-secreted protein n=1 Tax=Streptomyces sp. NPDC127077 TaxID=3347131 RepID=UPI0036580073
MSNRPADWHILDLDHDPTPGDPQRVRRLAGSLHDFADDVADILRDVKGLANDDAVLKWAGKTADSFASEFEDVPGQLKKLKKSYDIAGDALASYWPDLDDAQQKADKALRDGRKARQDLSTAQTSLSGADDWVRTATTKADSYDPDKNRGKDVPPPDEADVRRATRDAQHARERQTAARKDVDDAQGLLDAAKKLAAHAKGLREEAARRTVKKLNEASDAGIHNRHWWEEPIDWVSDHWDEIVTVCKWVVTIVGIIVMIVGGPLGWLVFAAALIVLADTVRKMLNGQAGWGDLIFAVLDCIPATKGFTSLAKMGKLWKLGGLRALGGAFMKGIGGGLRNLASTIRNGAKGMRQLSIALRDSWRARQGFKTPKLPPAGHGTKLLETLSESRIRRGDDGLISKIDGRPVSDYLKHVTDIRAQNYKDLVSEGTDAFRKKDLGDCLGVGVDRRTGKVYEGINGRKGNEIDPGDVHPTIRDSVDNVAGNGPYPDRDGALTFDYPHPDVPLRHAEVKATNMALHDRAAAGLPDGPSAMREITMNTHFPYMGGGKPAPFCANCHNVLGGVDSVAGRFPGWPPSDEVLIPGVTY